MQIQFVKNGFVTMTANKLNVFLCFSTNTILWQILYQNFAFLLACTIINNWKKHHIKFKPQTGTSSTQFYSLDQKFLGNYSDSKTFHTGNQRLYLPTPGAAEKTLVSAGHVMPINYLPVWGDQWGYSQFLQSEQTPWWIPSAGFFLSCLEFALINSLYKLRSFWSLNKSFALKSFFLI